MWFEAILICSAYAMCSGANAIFKITDKEAKMHITVCILAPVLFMFLYKRAFSVKELLAGYFILFILLFSKKLAGNIDKIPKMAVYITKASICILLYLLVIKQYMPDEHSGQISKEEVMCIFVGISFLLFFSDKIKKLLTVYVWVVVIFAPVLGFYIMERAYNTKLDAMSWQFVTANLLCLLCILVIPYSVIGPKAAIGLFLSVCLIFGVANYYVGMFRGSPVMPSDLLSAGTAFQVAGGYEFEISDQVIVSILLWFASIAVLWCLPGKMSGKNCRTRVIAASFAICVCSNYLISIDIEEKYDWQIDQWDVPRAYQTAGSLCGFTTLLKKMAIDVPEGYSRKKAEEILDENKPVESVSYAVEPSIIVIMDETFSDLRTLGDFACTDEYLENWYAVEDFACKGKLYVSVYGGWTANSEFEFLTGCSMANCGTGVVSYQSYNLKNVGNLADILGNRGYKTTAVHPQYKGNWNRMRVYGNFGFQNFLGIDDFKEPVYIRSHISDQSSFDKVIQLYEQHDRKKQFIFNVTMQNHGGYNIEELEGFDTIALKGESQNYQDVETYLTLIRESDQAIHDFIEYFRNVEEPVEICIFGDHLPSVNNAWVEHVMGKKADNLSLEELESKYAVPYMIWANYDTPHQKQEMDTSTNYLSALLLENAKITQTAYMNFLLHMRSYVPVLNLFGYQTSDGKWHSFEEKTDVSEWIDTYRILQYYTMFDSGRNMKNYR